MPNPMNGVRAFAFLMLVMCASIALPGALAQPVAQSTAQPQGTAAAQGVAPAQGAGAAKNAGAAKDSGAENDAGAAKASGSRKRNRPAGFHYGVKEPPARAKGAVRLASYNMLNLFDHVDDPALSGENEDITQATPAERCTALAEAIRRLDADILVLQEIESREALAWFRDTYLKGLGYDHLESFDAEYARGVEQSVLSRFPLKDARLLDKPSGDGFRYQRIPIRATAVLPGGYELMVVGIHHKAGGDAFNDQREAEAARIISAVKAELAANPSRNVAVVGDFNATATKEARKMYDRAGLLNSYDWRPWIEGKVTPEQIRDRFITHESGRAIDFILVSDGLANELVPDSFFVLSTLHPGDAYNWRTDKAPSGHASDHYPVAVDLIPVERDARMPGAPGTPEWQAKRGRGANSRGTARGAEPAAQGVGG
jgi:endonuclease/exonuclease/phosphatase family metal-dependent hydrolase